MLPIYLFGNLHCLGMCGPLVMMIGNHRYRFFYFLGRTLSFTLAGAVAGGIGAVSDIFLEQYHLAALTTFFFASTLLVLGIHALIKPSYIPAFAGRVSGAISKRLAKTTNSLSLLMLRDAPLPTFMFGFFTLALPCGQTLIVFSACALSQDLTVGLLNGLAFALLTSPSLFFAMSAHELIRRVRNYYQPLLGVFAIFVAILAFLRGFADLGWVEHLVLNPEAPSNYHIVIF